MRPTAPSICLLCFYSWTITYGQMENTDNFGNVLDQNAVVSPDVLQEKWVLMESRLTGLAQDMVKALLSRGIESLESLNVSPVCIRDVLRVIQGMKKLKIWAFKFFDSSSKYIDGALDLSLTSLGDYDECVNNEVFHERSGKRGDKVLFRGKYCRISPKLYLSPKPKKIKHSEPLDALRNFTTKDTVIGYAARFAHKTYYGSLSLAACVPSSCSENDVYEVLKKVSSYSGLYINKPRCEVKVEAQFTPDIVFVITLYSFTALLVIIGTGIEIYGWYRKTTFRSNGIQIFTSFSFISNFQRLTDTSFSPDSFTCFHGMKALTIMWIILAHNNIYLVHLKHKMAKVQEIAESFAYQPIMNSTLSVETFFFMSGVLLCYQMAKAVETGKRSFSFFLYIFHRIWRVFPAYAYVIAFHFVMPLIGSGPEFHFMVNLPAEVCKKNWWINLLFVNNFYDKNHVCFAESWYLAVDMQLYIGVLIILLPLMWWPKLGIVIAATTVIASMVGSWLSVYMGDLLPFTVFSFDLSLMWNTFNYFHAMPHVHVGPYCIGILCGYFLVKHPKIQIPKAIQITGWCVSTVSCLAILYGVQKWNAGVEPTFTETLFYSSCSRVAWALSMGWITICCKTGHGGLANYILSWKMWFPLGRLSLLAYLIHPLLIRLYLGTVRTELPADHHTGVWLFLGHTVLTYLFAAGVSLLVEAPFISLEKILLYRERNQEGKKKINEVQDGSTISVGGVIPIVLTKDVKDPEACANPDIGSFSCRM